MDKVCLAPREAAEVLSLGLRTLARLRERVSRCYASENVFLLLDRELFAARSRDKRDTRQ
jgi:hypothetical protein